MTQPLSIAASGPDLGSDDIAALRGRQALFVLKADIETADDAQLAELELEGLTGRRPVPFEDVRREAHWKRVEGDLARSGVAFDRVFAGTIPDDPGDLLRRLGIVEAIWSAEPVAPLTPVQNAFEQGVGATGSARPSTSSANRRKNEYLSHPLHKYKAKFFPRMARALANYTTPGAGAVLDPFVGSGTLLLESALMGVPSAGLDIDPLSACISEAKVDALHVETAELDAAISAFASELPGPGRQDDFPAEPPPDAYVLPEFLGRKMPETRAGIEEEVTTALSALATVPSGTSRQLLRVALSHAVATKISLRWMGTGDNRFALSLAKRSVGQILTAQLKRMRNAIAQRDRLIARGHLDERMLGSARVTIGDAREMPYEDGEFEGIVTSPPYLPASSGRETYLRSRAPSLVALGLLTEEEIIERDQSMIGSILRGPSGESTVLPGEVLDLVEWMKPQRARAPKALPTEVYFHDLARSLKEMGRVLATEGRLAMVVSTEHIFYDLLTRETVRTLNMPEVLQQLIDDDRNEIPLKVDRVVRIELPKMDFAARPASRGAYSESIILASRT